MWGTQPGKRPGRTLQGGTDMLQGCLEAAPLPETPTLFLFIQRLWPNSQISPLASSVRSHSRAGHRSWEVIWGHWDASSLPCHWPRRTGCLCSRRHCSISIPQVLGEWPLPRPTGCAPSPRTDLPAPTESRTKYSLVVFADERKQGPSPQRRTGVGATAPRFRDLLTRPEPFCVWATWWPHQAQPACPCLRRLSKAAPIGNSAPAQTAITGSRLPRTRGSTHL